jgi:spore maturation protein CgeB
MINFLNSSHTLSAKPYKNIRIALISDELTRSCLSHECKLRDVTPLNYRLLFKFWRPDFLFVESAWQGRRNAWKYKIASYPDHPERNNSQLQKVVYAATRLGIPCVFWNKEDGVHFERFISSASLFDVIFTVDVNCVERYRSRIGRNVMVKPLMFAVQPAVHYFSENGHKEKRACFLGSYSHHIHERRRKRQDMILSAASSEIGLTIFDRNSSRKSRVYRYPDFPGAKVRKSVTHEQTGQIYRQYIVSLNVNTIEDSETMFSRRLIEIIASGGLAVTTPAKSVDKYFKNYCHVVANENEARDLFRELKNGWRAQDAEMVRVGAENIRQNHTWTHRVKTILETIGKV